jgi:hypothetical protein
MTAGRFERPGPSSRAQPKALKPERLVSIKALQQYKLGQTNARKHKNECP